MKKLLPLILIITSIAISLILIVDKAREKEPLVGIEKRVDMLKDHEQRVTYLEENCKCND